MKILFAYKYCGLGGVEISILNKLEALRRTGVDGYAVFSEYCGVGGSSIAEHPRITVGLGERELIEFLHRDFDVISVIDYPEFLDVIAGANIQSKILFESHASVPFLIDHFYSKLDHPSIAAIVVPSLFNRRLVKQLSNTTKAIHVIPNPVD